MYVSIIIPWIRNWQTLPHWHMTDAARALTMRQHYSALNDVVAAILSILPHVRNLSPGWILDDRALGFF